MLYVVTLTYSKPKDVVAAHLDSHKAWLVRCIQSGHILAAGPMEAGNAGIIIATSESRHELDALLQQDSFHQNGLVDYDIRAFSPALRAEDFPAAWAADAKPVPVAHKG
ncbi:YciI family protein [Azorhizobium doebereinerae]|uniref:YciI family protein n=1 Tax=Azorhizobium doebereinerae TaxID=281091 RepID=UPI000426A992|nr:YciI family protein [Azorhizobium doebereinerae]